VGEFDGQISATELDSHANMIVLGGHCLEIGDSGKTAEVSSFSKETGALSQVPIKDAVCVYDCPKSGVAYLLVMRNGLWIPTNNHNLVPPFVMREAGLEVNERPKIHCNRAQVTEKDHSIYCPQTSLRIPLQLDGIFSYFPTRGLTRDEMEHPEEMPHVLLSPDTQYWDPYNESYAENEASFTDPRGEMVYPTPRSNHVLIEEDEFIPRDKSAAIARVDIDQQESPTAVFEYTDAQVKQIDAVISSSAVSMDVNSANEQAIEELLTLRGDEVNSQVSKQSCVLDPHLLRAKLDAAIAKSKFSEAVGSTWVNDEGCELFQSVTAAAPSVLPSNVSATSANGIKGVDPKLLSKIWRISHEEAERTVEVTTQYNTRDPDSPLSRRFGTNDRSQRYRRIDTYFFTDTFYVTAKARSRPRGNIGMQIYVSDKGYVAVYPVKAERLFLDTLKLFAKEVGVPISIIADPARAQKSNKVVQFYHKIGTTLKILEESTQWANRAELYVGLLKEAVRKDMKEAGSPLVLWDYCAELRAKQFNVTAKNLFQLQGQTPHFLTLGQQPDISNICQFKWWEWVYYRDASLGFPHLQETLGRYMGPAKNHGNEMTMWVMNPKGEIIPRTALRRLTPAELYSPDEINKRDAFDIRVKMRYGNSFTLPDPQDEVVVEEIDSNAYDPEIVGEEGSPDEPQLIMPDADSAVDARGNPITTNSIADTFINMEVLLPQGEEQTQLARVLRRSLDQNGKHVGIYDENPILNTAVYDVEFPDGTIKEYGANIIAENLLQSVDEDGLHSQFLEGILDHEKDDTKAVTKKFVTTRAGNRQLIKTTIGWKFKIKWKDGTVEWVPLKILKESNPVETAEYAAARSLVDEPAFAWWVPYVLKKRDRVIAAVTSRVKRATHKYGFRVPRSVKEAIEIDRINGNQFWQKALKKEMTNVGIAFKILEPHEKMPVGYTKSSGHIIFDVKMDLTKKARWVKDGHRTPDPETSSYAGVVSRESIRILLTYAALLGLDVWAADIRNAYLQAPTSEKHYIICGEEFGIENVGKRAIIERALYGGKCAGRDFWHHLRSCMKTLEFESSRADPDVWYRLAKRADGKEYYEYVLLYTDDCLVISERAESILRNEIGKLFKLKEESIGKPSQYLGGKMRQVELENGAKAWAFSSAQYCKAAVDNVEKYLKEKGEVLQVKAPTPLSSGYRPELDVSPELGDADASYYHSLIGMLRWLVELGRADINTEVSMMSSHLALPREGHLKEVLHIFAHLKKHHNAEMVFDPSIPEVVMEDFPREDWSYSIYADHREVPKEELPAEMPKPLGESFTIRVFVDADHAGEHLTRRSRTGFIVFLNNAPIYWISKKQTSCETSSFGSEFVAMKQACEYVRGLRYKLRMFGIPVEGPAFISGDNKSTLTNSPRNQKFVSGIENSHFVSGL